MPALPKRTVRKGNKNIKTKRLGAALFNLSQIALHRHQVVFLFAAV
jgi:hypothetical protein